jgi:hypothetical protein
MNAGHALTAIPSSLRDPLLSEYRSIIQNFFEHRWSPSELSGGKICEIVYTILDGHAKGTYAAKPIKPPNFLIACRALENNSQVPRGFQIFIPRLLPALYEVRNNRGVGHAGGDVDPNHMDATLVVSMCNWIMAELVRVFHNLTTGEAQALVDALAERTIPIIWEGENVKRVLDTALSLRDQILMLAGSSGGPVPIDSLIAWTETKNKTYFRKVVAELHKSRFVEHSSANNTIVLLPYGAKRVAELSAAKTS